MEIVIITPWFPTHPEGWPSRYISDSALALAQRGHKVRVIVVRAYAPFGLTRLANLEYHGEIQVKEFIGLESIDVVRHLMLPKGLFRRFTNSCIDFVSNKALKKLYKQKKPDVILAHTEFLAPISAKFGVKWNVPAYTMLHGENTNEAYLNKGGQKTRHKKGLGNCKRVIIVGKPLRGYAEKLSGRKDNITVVCNGVTAPSTQRIPPQPDIAPIRFVCVGALHQNKGIDLLITALANVSAKGYTEWDLRIIGTGPQLSVLENQTKAEKLEGKIKFMGSMPNSAVFDTLSTGDVFVLPSFKEAFGIVYIEAMTSNLLSIGVKDQGASQFIEDGRTGYLVEPESAVDLTRVILSLFESGRNKWREIAKNGNLFARENYTWEKHAETLEAVFNED